MSFLNEVWESAFWWLAALHLADGIFGLLALRSARFKAAFFRMPILVQKLWPVVDVGLVLVLPLVPQPRWTFIPAAAGVTVGLAAVAGAVALWLHAFRAIGFIPSLRPVKGLIATGPYAVVRHPIYLANLLSALGLALVFRAGGAVCYWPVVAALLSTGILVEEKGLRMEYGEEYAAYMKQVPYRLIPYVY